jgi:hypothetical protein
MEVRIKTMTFQRFTYISKYYLYHTGFLFSFYFYLKPVAPFGVWYWWYITFERKHVLQNKIHYTLYIIQPVESLYFVLIVIWKQQASLFTLTL